MKRYISLSCILLVLVACVASPVSASDLVFSNMVQLLDYGTANNSGSNYISFSGSAVTRYSVPAATDYNYVDMLVYCAGAAPTSISVGGYDSALHNLTILRVSGDYYRVYGKFNSAFFPEFVIKFNSSGDSWYTVLSIRAGLSGYDSLEVESYCEISAYDYNKTIHYVPTDEINSRTFTGTDNFSLAEYNLFLYLDESWKKYDYVDFLMLTTVDSVVSVSAGIGSISIPHSVSFLDNDSMSTNQFIYNVRLDLRNLDRTINDFPMITVTGNVITSGINVITVLGTTAYVSTDVVDADVFWLNRIFNKLVDVFDNITGLRNDQNSLFTSLSSWIQTQTSTITETLWNSLGYLREDLFIYFGRVDSWISTQTNILESAIRGDTAPGDSFQQEVNQKDQQLNDMAAVMESVEQPDLNSVNVAANSYVDSTVLAASMSGITSVFSQGLYFDVILMSIMMATAGYVLFGKR